ncbi:MAG TPA: bifunctional riboflavin kinase/FAD synthetase [Mobilitalea sp.]|nr:bifunctional riboflavin kinase/FAD synthetase [Mobilitalea sp.]
MEYIAGNTDFKFHNSAVTLGKFDGIHLGHQHLINQVISYKAQGLTAIMFSFLYHPRNLFSDKEFEVIYTEEEKLAKLQKTGMDVLISYPFTEETRNIEPENFIKDILIDKLDAKVIVVGDDFHFGKQRKGNVELLLKQSETYGYKVIVCEKKKWQDTIISSSTIRNELKEGHMNAVNEMLGAPYSIIGVVMHGRRIGRTLGMPTTNLIPAGNKLLPPCGVYASKTIIDGVEYYGVTNIGYKPTVGTEENRGAETYIFDFEQDVYGKEITVELFFFMRPELKFNSLDELKSVMRKDIEAAKEFFKVI